MKSLLVIILIGFIFCKMPTLKEKESLTENMSNEIETEIPQSNGYLEIEGEDEVILRIIQPATSISTPKTTITPKTTTTKTTSNKISGAITKATQITKNVVQSNNSKTSTQTQTSQSATISSGISNGITGTISKSTSQNPSKPNSSTTVSISASDNKISVGATTKKETTTTDKKKNGDSVTNINKIEGGGSISVTPGQVSGGVNSKTTTTISKVDKKGNVDSSTTTKGAGLTIEANKDGLTIGGNLEGEKETYNKKINNDGSVDEKARNYGGKIDGSYDVVTQDYSINASGDYGKKDVHTNKDGSETRDEMKISGKAGVNGNAAEAAASGFIKSINEVTVGGDYYHKTGTTDKNGEKTDKEFAAGGEAVVGFNGIKSGAYIGQTTTTTDKNGKEKEIKNEIGFNNRLYLDKDNKNVDIGTGAKVTVTGKDGTQYSVEKDKGITGSIENGGIKAEVNNVDLFSVKKDGKTNITGQKSTAGAEGHLVQNGVAGSTYSENTQYKQDKDGNTIKEDTKKEGSIKITFKDWRLHIDVERREEINIDKRQIRNLRGIAKN